jgi:hypothetical protein
LAYARRRSTRSTRSRRSRRRKRKKGRRRLILAPIYPRVSA